MKTRLSVMWVVLATMLCVVAPADALAAESVVAREAEYFTAVAYRDTVAWNSFERTRRVHRLRVARDGRPVRAPFGARRAPFDVGVGPDRSGRTTVVFSACRRPEAKSCERDLFQFHPGDRRAVPVRGAHRKGVDESMPAIWRGRVAFVRRARSGRRRSGLATVTSGGRLKKLANVRFPQTGAEGDVVGRPERLALRGDRLVVSASTELAFCKEDDANRKIEPVRSGIFVLRLDRGTRRLLDEGCDDDPTHGVQDGQLAEGHIFYVVSRRPADGDPFRSDRALREVRLDGRLVRETPVGEATNSYAIGDQARYEVRYVRGTGPRARQRPWRLVRTR